MCDQLLAVRVLYVEDDATNRHVMREMLQACGIGLTCANSGPEALQILATQTFDVVLMDLHMPGMDGAQTLRRMRASDGPGRWVRTVLVTADLGFEGEASSLGFDGFLAKPLSLRPLLSAVLASLQRQARYRPMEYRAVG